MKKLIGFLRKLLKVKAVRRLLDNFVKRMGRVVVKVKEDKYKKQNWRD